MQRARTPERGITHEARGAGGLSVKDLYENTKKLLPMLLVATGMAKSAEAADMPPSAKAAEAQLSQRPSAVEVAKGWVKDSPLILDTSSGSAAVRFAPEGVRITPTFFEKQPGGEVNFNAWSILAPVQLEVPWTQRIPQRSSTEMPYEYARLFAPDPKSGEPQRRSDQEKIVSYIGQQLKQDFAGTLHGLDMSKTVYRQQHHLEEAQAKPGDSIEIIRFVGFGFASPEGPAQKGTGTLEHGEIDQENIDLARVRGIQALGATKKALERQGVDTSTLGKAAQEARAAERQFSFAEVRTLAKLAQEFSGTDTREKVFEMTKAYNDGVISPEVGKQLDAIFATKRAARVVVDYEGDKKDTYLIPLPLVLLLLPALPRLSR
ncbi:hypothetical protein HYV71_01890, partial [Candidatus Uhrbacteria bacterium]|nr:hypothetical protein [Candidatus Uhrbacteria bacterium]